MKRWMIVCAILVVGVVSVQGSIVHRYGMSDPNDSVGTANAALVNNTGNSSFSGGLLNLAGAGASGDATIDYLDLPNGIISALGTQATFETWTTWKTGGNWARIFDFGTSNGGENLSNGGETARYIFLTPQRGDATGTMRFGMNMPVPTRVENVVDSSAGILPALSEQHIVISYDEVNQVVLLFLNGVQVGQGVMPAGFKLADMTDNNNWLGRAQYGDPMYGGSYNEFRIYNHAMNASEVAASLAAGTDVTIATPVSPKNLTKEVVRTPTLQWAAGYIPADYTKQGYRLYLSDNLADVQNGEPGASKGEITTTSYTVPAALKTDATYYWRVDEKVLIRGNTDPNYVKGGVVSFETIKTYPVLTGTTLAYGLFGKSANLSVNIQSGSNVISVAWYKFVDGTNDTLLPAGAKYGIASSNTLTTLTINGIVAEDAGMYYAKVQNSAGVQTSAQINMLVRKGLAHRYSFTGNGSITDPNMIDSVGGANGILLNKTGNARYENNVLVLGNNGGQGSAENNGDFVDLPNGIISALGNLATFETWTGWNGPVNWWWQRVFDFGTSSGGEDVSAGNSGNSIFMAPLGGAGDLLFSYRDRGINMVRGPLPSDGEIVHIALVWDGQKGVARMYFNGKFVGQNNLHFALSDLTDNNNWLGRSQWPDALYVGRFDEFRIYDIPFDDGAILAHYQAGPNVIGQDKPCTAYPAGDANGDCKVTMEDLALMAANWLVCGGPVCQ